MNKKFFLTLFLLLIIPIAYADEWPICIDTKAPSAPTGLSFSGNVLSWTASTDQPDCSGISHYEIYRGSTLLDNVYTNSYTDVLSLPDGTYNYKVVAVDLVGHKTESAIIQRTISTSSGGSSGGSGGGSGGGGGGGGGGSSRVTTPIPPSPPITQEETNNAEEPTKTITGNTESLDVQTEQPKKNVFERFFSSITGSFVGPQKTTWTGVGVILVIVGIGLMIFMIATRRKIKGGIKK